MTAAEREVYESIRAEHERYAGVALISVRKAVVARELVAKLVALDLPAEPLPAGKHLEVRAR
jgi:hypothetical protein